MMTAMMKFPLCGDSLLIIFMGGSLMAVFGIAMVGINRKAQHQVSNLVYALEILTILPILCWRVYESCRELEEMHEKVLLVQAAITTQEVRYALCFFIITMSQIRMIYTVIELISTPRVVF